MIGYNRATALMRCFEGELVTAPDETGWRRMQATGQLSPDDLRYQGPPSFSRHERLCFYPSSGDHDVWKLLELDCDFFVLAEQQPDAVSWSRIQAEFATQGLPVTLIFEGETSLSFHSQGKTVLMRIEDPEKTLKLIQRLNLVISRLIGANATDAHGLICTQPPFW